MRVIPEAGRIR